MIPALQFLFVLLQTRRTMTRPLDHMGTMNSCLGTAGKIRRIFSLCCIFLAVIGSTAAAGVPRCVSAFDFGARSDGAADDTASIQKALDAVSTASNSIVRLPAGVYKISSTLRMHDSTTLCGDGSRDWANQLRT